MLEKRIERLEEDMTTLKYGVRRLNEKISGVDSLVSPGGWISEAFDGVHQRIDDVERQVEGISQRIDNVEKRLSNLEERLDEHKQMLALILERLSPPNSPS